MPRPAQLLGVVLQWLLWLLCLALTIPVLLNVPGMPTWWELALYAALLVAITGYPILLPAWTILAWRARRRQQAPAAARFRRAAWVSFGMTASIIGVMAAVLFASAPPPLEGDARIERQFSMAITYHDLPEVQALVEGGANVNHPMFNNGTPAGHAALARAWPILQYLIENGADPDHADNLGWTPRGLYEQAEPPRGGNGADAQAYRALRTWFDRRPEPAQAADERTPDMPSPRMRDATDSAPALP